MKSKKIKVPIFLGTITLIKVENWDPINKKFGYTLDNTTSACTFKRIKDNNLEIYVAFKKKPSNRIIVHESCHVVNYIFSHLDIKLCVDNDEVQAYLTSWVFRKIEKYFR